MFPTQDLTHSPGASAARRRGGETVFFEALIVGVVLLFLGQLLTGTEMSFAAGVLLSLLVAIFTWRWIGIDTIAGVLIAVMAFSYLFFSQIVKTIYDQPGDSNLNAPGTTIAVMLVGMISICAGALIVSSALGNRRIIQIDPSPETLLLVRNISLAIGMIFLAYNLISGSMLEGPEQQRGGFTAIAHQYGGIIQLPVLAETWRILSLSKGKSSLSVFSILLVGGLAAMGFIYNSKQGMVDPTLVYFIGAIGYRRYVTRGQIWAAVTGIIVFVFLFYPAIQLLRRERGWDYTISSEVIGNFVHDAFTDPASFFVNWVEEEQNLPTDDLFSNSLNYVGHADQLASRFMLIVNTDVIVAAVNEDGPYGASILALDLEEIIPTFLDPDKPRDYSGDLYLWTYGLRTWYVSGAPTIGVFADSFAILGWPGITLLPLALMLMLFTEIQLCGRSLAGNFLGGFYLFLNYHSFTENSVGAFATTILRNVPVYTILVLACFYLADLLTDRKRRRANRIPIIKEGPALPARAGLPPSASSAASGRFE